MILPGVIWYIMSRLYTDIWLDLAFKSYRANLGIFGVHGWVCKIIYVFRDPALESVWRTLFINFGRIIFQFPYPIILALLLNELRINRFKKPYRQFLHFHISCHGLSLPVL